MKELKKHQTLIEIESLVNRALSSMTNQMYSRKIKLSYKLEWSKGDAIIDNGKGSTTKNYYYLRFYLINKTESPVGLATTLLINYYPVLVGKSNHHMLEEAYKEFLLNGVQALANVTYTHHLSSLEKEVITPKDVTPKDVQKEDIKNQLEESAKVKIII